MIRRLFTVTAVLSLLLCIGTVVLWTRSYRLQQSLTWPINSERFTIGGHRGRIAHWGRINLRPLWRTPPAFEGRTECTVGEIREG